MQGMREKEWAVFGAPLDPLDAPEKVEMKLAYLQALGKGGMPAGHPRDPYDLLVPQLEAAARGVALRRAGKVETEDWLTPRPSPRSRPRLTPQGFGSFIDTDGCRRQAARVEGFVREELLPARPLMVGVDHSQTAGVIEALAGLYGRELRLVILDAHSDIISTTVRQELYRMLRDEEGEERLSGKEPGFPAGTAPDSFNCGSFLHHLLEEGKVDPRRLLVLGAADLPPHRALAAGGSGALALGEFARLLDRGVGFLGQRELREGGMRPVREALEGMGRGPFYVSIDLDVGALDAVGACRFMDLVGLGEEELLGLAAALAGWLGEEGNSLVGLDVMEMDIHLAGLKHRDGSRDRTARVAVRMARTLLEAD